MSVVNPTPKRRSRLQGDRLEKTFPVVLFAVAALAGLLVLPSALRPPNQQPNQTAELSPDAPPDDDPEALISSLNRGASGVGSPSRQGEGTGAPGEGPEAVTATTSPSPPTTLVPRACPKGVGTPPRQVESIYSASCAGPFTGNNGGATYKGVTKDEIRLAVRSTGNRGQGNNCATNGRIADKDPALRNPAERTFFTFQEYFNQNFQFYGRRLVFYCSQPEGGSIDENRASAINAAETYDVYGQLFASTVECDEFARRKMVAICEGLSDADYAANAPYKWASYESGSDNARAMAEYICKKLKNKNAERAGDSAYHTVPRKLGLITYGNRGFGAVADVAEKALADCGVPIKTILTTPNADSDEGNAQLTLAITSFKNDGVTTVLPLLDVVAMAVLTNAASAQNYFPEWLANDGGAITANNLAGTFLNPGQWANAFGLTYENAERPTSAMECYRAYRTIDAANSANEVICDFEWRAMMLYVSAIQEAGPNLNPQTQKAGFYKLSRYWKTPSWAPGGQYAPGKYGYLGDFAEVWWDPTASDPRGRVVGAYRYVDNGKRYCLGGLTSEFKAFQPENAPSLVPDFDKPANGPPAATCREAHG